MRLLLDYALLLAPGCDRLGAYVPIAVVVAGKRPNEYPLRVVLDLRHRVIIAQQAVSYIHECLLVKARCTLTSLERDLWIPFLRL